MPSPSLLAFHTTGRMSLDSPLDALAARWAARPEAGVFAPLADALRKRGDLEEAARVVAAGLARFPGQLTGLVVQARIAIDRGDVALAGLALAEALERDPGHPLARDLADALAPRAASVEDDAGPLIFTDDEPVGAAPDGVGAGGEPADEAPEFLTESMAALYHHQGHLEAALAAYAELVSRDPGNGDLVARHRAVEREVAASRPLPFDARQSGGRSVADWLGAVAAARPSTPPRPASFDAFFEPPAPPAPRPDPGADFDAFKRWLEELAR